LPLLDRADPIAENFPAGPFTFNSQREDGTCVFTFCAGSSELTLKASKSVFMATNSFDIGISCLMSGSAEVFYSKAAPKK
jgi:hypothetical protein